MPPVLAMGISPLGWTDSLGPATPNPRVVERHWDQPLEHQLDPPGTRRPDWKKGTKRTCLKEHEINIISRLNYIGPSVLIV